MKKYLFLLGLLMSTLSLFAQEASIGKSFCLPSMRVPPGIWER